MNKDIADIHLVYISKKEIQTLSKKKSDPILR